VKGTQKTEKCEARHGTGKGKYKAATREPSTGQSSKGNSLENERDNIGLLDKKLADLPTPKEKASLAPGRQPSCPPWMNWAVEEILRRKHTGNSVEHWETT